MTTDLSAIVANPYNNWPARYPGKRAMGYLCSYVPEEILHAAGFTPIRILPAGGPAPHAEAHLQGYSCSLARGCLERSLTGELDLLAGVVFAHTCDTMQCLTDVWREGEDGGRRMGDGGGPRRKPPWVGWVVQPVTLTSPHAKAYLVAELKRFARSLEEHFEVRVTDDALRASIALYNRHRRLLADCYAQRSSLSAATLWNIANAAMLMPPEDFGFRISDFGISDSLPSARNRQSLVLSGATLDDPAMLSLLEELGGQVVGDDLCNGERYFDTPVAESGDPWEALAERYLHRTPCPCKHSGLDVREKHLLNLVHTRQAQGVIFVLKKFCEPHAWDYPHLAAALQKAGIPHLLLETEATTPLGVVRTRIEAFLEMLE